MRKVDLSNVPMKKNKGGYLWLESIGLDIPFEYDNHIGSFKIIEYINSEHIKVLYNNQEFDLLTRAVRDGQIEKIFGKEINWKYNIGDKIQDIVCTHQRDLIITNKKWDDTINNRRNNKWYQYKCNVCGYDCSIDDSWINEEKLKKGQGCSCCAGVKVVKGINDISTTDPWMVKYFVNIDDAYTHTRTSSLKFLMRCPICGKEKMLEPSHLLLQGFACLRCGDGISFPEKVLISILDQLHIKYKYQLNKKYFKWCGKYKYDFYLIDYNYIIETHGMQHYELRKGSKFGKLEEIQENDKTKRELALNNKIDKYIELDCRFSKIDWITNSINNSPLKDIIDLTKVDFNEIEKYTNSSLFLDVCKMYNENYPNITIDDLLDKFVVCKTTIIKYLKSGTKIGLCNYYN